MASLIHPHGITIRQHHILFDQRVMHDWAGQLDGRFWGITGVLGMIVGFGVSFAISPRLLTLSGAFSDFGSSIRTAPFFTGSLLYASYCLRHWRRYVIHTLQRQNTMSLVFALESISLVLIALMPYAWQPWPSRIHVCAVALLGASISMAMVLDGVLTLPQKAVHGIWQLLQIVAFVSVVAGEVVIFCSNIVHLLDVTLLGEILLFSGYGAWIVTKTFAKVDSPSTIKSLLHRLTLD